MASRIYRNTPLAGASQGPDNETGTRLRHRILIVGQGYVGLSLGLEAIGAGHEVIGYDTDSSRTRCLVQGRSPVGEVSESRVSEAIRTGRYVVTSEPSVCRGMDVAVIAVSTPARDGRPDLDNVRGAAHMVGAQISRGALVILESTTYPGTTEDVVGPIIQERSGLLVGSDFALAYSPERIDPGNPGAAFRQVPKLVAGVNQWSRDAARDFYSGLVDVVIPVASIKEAELAKLIENIFRAVNIALANELCMTATGLGIDFHAALRAASTKPFGFMPFYPGPGVGGHCIPVDPSYLNDLSRTRLGTTLRLIDAASEINRQMPNYVVGRLAVGLSRRGIELGQSRVLQLGLAYKRNTGDLRMSPALDIGLQLVDLGVDLRVCDPRVSIEGQLRERMVTLDETEIAHADAVLVTTDHDDFDYQMIVQRARYVFDTRNRTHGANVERL